MARKTIPPNPNTYQIAPGPRRSELEMFASFFFQDWYLIFPDFYTGVDMYISAISRKQRQILSKQLEQFVEDHKTPAQLKQAWLNAGAQAWPPELEIVSTLRDFAKIILEKEVSTVKGVRTYIVRQNSEDGE